MRATDLILSYIRALQGASGAAAVSVFVPTWPGQTEDVYLLHSGPEPAAVELSTLESAFAFSRERSTASAHRLPPGSTDIQGRLPGSVLLPIPLVTSLWKQPPRPAVASESTPGRRAADHQPATTAGWVALRFDNTTYQCHPLFGRCRSSLNLAADLASLYLKLYGSLTDPLTGLPGRAEFRSLLRDELARSRAESLPCSIVMFNPEGLAAFNATHGRKAVDQLLREVVIRAQDTLRHTDVLCRYGGAIFAIALRNTGTKAAGIVADKLRLALGEVRYLDGQLAIAFSAGAATAAHDDVGVRDPVDLVGRAEAALALAKQDGGGRTCVWRAGETRAPVVLDRLRCAFTGDQERDYRNMGLLWDTVGLLATGGTTREFAQRVVSQLRRTFATSLAALFEVGPRGLELAFALGPGNDAEKDEIGAAALAPHQRGIVAEAAEGSVAVWIRDCEPDVDGPGPITCAVPLLVGDTHAGVLLLRGGSAEVKFDESDLPFLEGFARPLGFALERTRAAERQREQEQIEKRRLVGELRDLRSALHRARLVHTSTQMDELIMTAHRVADTDATVLISGESGTGKELLAQTIHQMSRRRDRPFVIVDCGAIPASLIESELFGHERGAFTGANTRAPGRLVQADRGTVLLDEIGELPLEVQSKLLRFVQDRQFTPVGSSATRAVDVRLLAATNRELSQEVDLGRFRADLFHRLNVISLVVPPLRERPDDILEIARHFLEIFAAKHHKPATSLGTEVEDALLSYSWPGNVRELQNRIMRAVIMSTGRTLTAEGLSLPVSVTTPVLKVVGGNRGRQWPLALTAAAPGSPGEMALTHAPAETTAVAGPVGGASEAWALVRAALDQVLAGIVTGPAKQYPPLGRWLANDLVLAAFEQSSRVAARGASALGLAETTFVRRLRRAQQEAHLVRRPPEWSAVSRAVEALVRVRHPEGQNVLEEAETRLLSGIRHHLRGDGAAGAYLLGTSLPTYRRRLATLAEAS
jgi:diguanylate cyclase (GGDEF)-like protein